mmetsp:Transcript_12394/g.34127  ORF Transcript_12394/g.34127 Transcript_12394/m.34127 type:complete len:200 (+) Transcript_12394:1753-2352(+)
MMAGRTLACLAISSRKNMITSVAVEVSCSVRKSTAKNITLWASSAWSDVHWCSARMRSRRYSVFPSLLCASWPKVLKSSFFSMATTSATFLGVTREPKHKSMTFLRTSMDGQLNARKMSMAEPSIICLWCFSTSLRRFSTINFTLLSDCSVNNVTYAEVAWWIAMGEDDNATREEAHSNATAVEPDVARSKMIFKKEFF